MFSNNQPTGEMSNEEIKARLKPILVEIRLLQRSCQVYPMVIIEKFTGMPLYRLQDMQRKLITQKRSLPTIRLSDPELQEVVTAAEAEAAKLCIKGGNKSKKSISELADKFHEWMTEYNHPKQTDNEGLLDWLHCDSGAKYIDSYESFIELATTLAASKGYKCDTTISKEDYDIAMGIAEKKEMKKFALDFARESINQHYRGRAVQSAATVALLDAMDGYKRPGGARDIYESDIVDLNDTCKPSFK